MEEKHIGKTDKVRLAEEFLGQPNRAERRRVVRKRQKAAKRPPYNDHQIMVLVNQALATDQRPRRERRGRKP